MVPFCSCGVSVGFSLRGVLAGKIRVTRVAGRGARKNALALLLWCREAPLVVCSKVRPPIPAVRTCSREHNGPMGRHRGGALGRSGAMLNARARMSHERTADAVDLMDMHAGATCALSNAVRGTLVPLYYLLRAARCRAHARGARTCPGARCTVCGGAHRSHCPVPIMRARVPRHSRSARRHR